MPDLEEFYRHAYPRLVGVLAAVLGDRREAEDVAQEAFVRLIPRWRVVAGYDDPFAWLRRVAFRIATSRWRRSRVAAAALPRLPGRRPDAEPGVEQTQIVAALLQLPIALREVVVLYYWLDTSVDALASELGVAPGTVKSRLARARQKLSFTLTPAEEKVGPHEG